MSSTTLTLANVLYEKRGAIAYVTINRPKVLNALNTATWKDLRSAFEDARDDAAVRGVILTGAGDKAFVAGADISELAHASAIDAERSSRYGQEVLDLVENLGNQRLCTGRRLRDRNGVHHPHRRRARQIRPARGQARIASRRRRHATVAAAGRKGPRAPAHSVRRDHQRAGGLSHRARQRSRSGSRSHPACGSHPEDDRFERPCRCQAIARSCEQGIGYEPERGLCAGSLLLRPVCRNGGQKGRHVRLPREARPPVPGAVKQARRFRRDPMASDNIFSGLKVVDFASFVAAPGAAVILSDFGADVIKVEPPSGDPWRHAHKIPPQPLADDPYQWHLANRNKRSITLDLKSPSAHQVVEQLVRWADVLIVNTPHPARKKLKLEYDDVARWNPRLIYADLTGFGEKGPDSELPGFDITSYW